MCASFIFIYLRFYSSSFSVFFILPRNFNNGFVLLVWLVGLIVNGWIIGFTFILPFKSFVNQQQQQQQQPTHIHIFPTLNKQYNYNVMAMQCNAMQQQPHLLEFHILQQIRL